MRSFYKLSVFGIEARLKFMMEKDDISLRRGNIYRPYVNTYKWKSNFANLRKINLSVLWVLDVDRSRR